MAGGCNGVVPGVVFKCGGKCIQSHPAYIYATALIGGFVQVVVWSKSKSAPAESENFCFTDAGAGAALAAAAVVHSVVYARIQQLHGVLKS